MKELPDNIKEVIIKQFQGEAGPEDRQLLEEWLLRYPEYESECRELLNIWKESGNMLKEPEFNTANAWVALDRRLAGTKKHLPARIISITRFTKAIVAAVVLTGLVFAGWWMLHNRELPLQTVSANAANKYLVLPDGTTVWLRKGATIKYPVAFKNKERKVLLTGEAFFDVQPAIDPFRIQTGKSMVEVLGTSFLVYATDASDKVVVITGKVRVANKRDPEKQCVLSAGEQALFTGNSYQKQAAIDSGYQFWQKDALRFSRTPLKQVVKDLTAYYRTPVIITDTLALRSDEINVTAGFHEQSLEQVMNEITIFTGLHYRRQQDTIIFY